MNQAATPDIHRQANAMLAKNPPVDDPSGRGVAFATTMLTRPTQRRLMTLWSELSGQRTASPPRNLKRQRLADVLV